MNGLRNLSQTGAGTAACGSRRRSAATPSSRACTATGVTREENPEVELVLTIELPGRAPYEASVRQVLSRQVLHNLRPGRPVSVAVDPDDPARLEIG